MSQFSNQVVKTFAANQSVTAYTIVSRAATSTMAVLPWNTTTSLVLGIARDNASTGDALEVVIGGTAKVICSASVSAGSLVGPTTATAGYAAAITGFFTTSAYKYIGIALEAGSTNSVIEVALQFNNVSHA